MKHSVYREWLLITVLLLVGIIAAARGDWFQRVDQTGYDLAMGLWQRPVIPEVVIIGIDEASLAQVGRWPWRRTIQAALIEKIAAAAPAVIGYDVIFVEPDRTDIKGDQLFANAIKQASRVILPVIPRIEQGTIFGEALPVSPIREAALSLAMIKSQTDGDGVMRVVNLRGGAGDARYRFLGFEAAHQSGLYVDALSRLERRYAKPYAQQDARSDTGRSEPGGSTTASVWIDRHSYRIPFAGPPGHFRVIPAIDILRGDVVPATLRGKIVLVGLTASGLGDEYPTPVSGGTRAMSGIEIHANVLQGIVEEINLKQVGHFDSGLLAAVLVVVLMGGYLWLTPRGSLLLAIAIGSLLGVVTIVLFRWAGLWISPTLALFSVFLTYPLWSWRRLEATQRYFDEELARLANEPDVVPIGLYPPLPAPTQSHKRVPEVITQRIDALTMATARLRGLKRFVVDSIESLPTAALVVDFDGVIMLSNTMAGRLFSADPTGHAPMPLTGQTLLTVLARLRPSESIVWQTVVDGGRLRHHNALSPHAASNEIVTVEAKTIPPADERDCVVQFAPMFSHLGEATGLIVTVADVTPLRESERRRDEALRFLSHDMRSPQASIITLLEMVREDPESMSHADLLERIGKYSRRTLNLADDFLRLAKAERVKPADCHPVDLAEILHDVIDEGNTAARTKSIRITAHIDVEARVSVDRDLFTRAVINLLSNAIKYSPDHTVVDVALVAEKNSWRINVADEGMGIAPENMSKLFTRFQRLYQEGQPETDGIGLGLVFVKTAIERMGGEVRVESRVATQAGEQHGTTFSILLPAVDDLMEA